MNRYRVYGHTTVHVTVEVEAENEADAIEEALNELCGLESYVGNGGTDKLIGVSGEGESVEANGEIEYTQAELLGPAEGDEDEGDEFYGEEGDDQ